MDSNKVLRVVLLLGLCVAIGSASHGLAWLLSGVGPPADDLHWIIRDSLIQIGGSVVGWICAVYGGAYLGRDISDSKEDDDDGACDF